MGLLENRVPKKSQGLLNMTMWYYINIYILLYYIYTHMYIFRDSHRQTFLDKPMAATRAFSAKSCAVSARFHGRQLGHLHGEFKPTAPRLPRHLKSTQGTSAMVLQNPSISIDIHRTCWSYCNVESMIRPAALLLWSSGSIIDVDSVSRSTCRSKISKVHDPVAMRQHGHPRSAALARMSLK